MRELRPHQAHGLAMLRQAIGSGKRRPVLCAPTGAGKTLLAAAVVDGALRKGKRVTFTVPALSLIDQTVQAFWNEGIRDVGVIQAAHPMTDMSRPVQVASVQTLQRRPLPESDVVVIDECHRFFAFYGEWMQKPEWLDKPFIGLSATPWTRGLGKHFDTLIIAATTADLIKQSYLSPFRVYAPSHPDLSHVRTVAGDYHEGDLSDVMDAPELTADVVDTWRKLGQGRPTFCFAVDRAHAKRLEQQFAGAGIAAAYIDAYTPVLEREEIRKAFHRGEVKVVCNVGVLTTGIDWDVRCIILARPTKSEMLFVQMIGRGLRTAAGKDDCLILDHSDTHLRLGFVTDIHHDHLDDGKPRSPPDPTDKAKLPKECPQCSFLKPAKVQLCPACGFKPEVRSNVKVGDGELTEFTVTRGKQQFTSTDLQRWYSSFLLIAQERGYKPGWAKNQYREKFGDWPPRSLIEVPIMRGDPGADVLGWVRHRQIAYAKRRQAA